MEGADACNFDLENVGPRVNGGEVDDVRCSVDELVMKLDKVHINSSIKVRTDSRFCLFHPFFCAGYIIPHSHSVSFTLQLIACSI